MQLRSGRFALLLLVSSLCGAGSTLAANLVVNGNFESYTSCPTSYGQLSVAAPWDAPTTGTSDYLNACAPVVFPSLNVPQNQLGYEPALSGVGYGGFIP